MSSEQVGGTSGPGPVSDRMRALLSRAAEEQLLEQRQVSAVLGDLRALVEDVDERLATGAQVDRVAAQVHELSARVEARLDEAEARAEELAERISAATAMVGKAAQDLVEAVTAGVADRVEAQLRERTAGSLEQLLLGSERRLATHVDDAVLALAEVVLRRRSAGTVPAARPAPDSAPAAPPEPQDAADPAPSEDRDADAAEHEAVDQQPVDQQPVEQELVEPEPVAAPVDAVAEVARDVTPEVVDRPLDAPADAPAQDEAVASTEDDGSALPDGPPAGHPLDDEPEPSSAPAARRDGFVLVPADVETVDVPPAPDVQHERRSDDRRGAERSDGSGRRLRPWWRPV